MIFLKTTSGLELKPAIAETKDNFYFQIERKSQFLIFDSLNYFKSV